MYKTVIMNSETGEIETMSNLKNIESDLLMMFLSNKRKSDNNEKCLYSDDEINKLINDRNIEIENR